MAALIPRPAPGVGGWGFQLTSALVCADGLEIIGLSTITMEIKPLFQKNQNQMSYTRLNILLSFNLLD